MSLKSDQLEILFSVQCTMAFVTECLPKVRCFTKIEWHNKIWAKVDKLVWPRKNAHSSYSSAVHSLLPEDNLFKNIFDITTAGDWDCVAVVERLRSLHYSVDFIFLSLGSWVSLWNFETIRGSLMRRKWLKLASLAQKICTL